MRGEVPLGRGGGEGFGEGFLEGFGFGVEEGAGLGVAVEHEDAELARLIVVGGGGHFSEWVGGRGEFLGESGPE